MQNISMIFLAMFLATALPTPAICQDNLTLQYYLPEDAVYDPSVPAPETMLGFQVGARHAEHHEVVAYMRELARTSDRVRIEETGRTYEQRPLLLLTITSPDNHVRIEDIRQKHLALCDPEQSAQLDLSGMPAVVWLGYSVHGNEASGMNASLAVAYYLAACRDAAVTTLLSNTVILLDPSLNPDGAARFAGWVSQNRSQQPVADPAHREHFESWPAGRTNHYWFDLNRDWLLAQHPESRGRLDRFHAWRPNVQTDHHEMQTDRTFFFMPGIPSSDNPLTPQRTVDLTAKIAQYHAGALNESGALYYSEESFDDFYYGKGSTYPDINGGIGILFEQASSRGLLQEGQYGPLSFAYSVRNHVTASLSTLKAAGDLRVELLEHQRTFYRSALEEARKDPVKAYVFGAADDPARTFHMLEILNRHKIAIHQLARAYEQFTPASGFVIPCAQPQYRLIRTLFDTPTVFRDSLFYDVSAWTLPLAMHMPYAPVTSSPQPLLGQQLTELQFPEGELNVRTPAYAFAFEWNGYYAPRALYRLQNAGIKTVVAEKPFDCPTSAGVQQFTRGTIIIPMGIQQMPESDVLEQLRYAAHKDALTVHTLETGLTPAGIDLGSPNTHMLAKPDILLAVGGGVNGIRAGEIWHLLDSRQEIPVSLVDTDRFGALDWTRYSVMILPDGSYAGIADNTVNNLRQWVERGGTLIAMQGAARWLDGKKLADLAFRSTPGDSAVSRKPYDVAVNDQGARVIGGAILRARLDITHPLGFGYQNPELCVFRQGAMILKPPVNPYAMPLQYLEQPLAAGYISARNLSLLKESAAIVVCSIGNGRIIAVMDNLSLRAYWYGTNKLLLNAIFFGKIINADTTVRMEEAQ